MQNHSDDVAAFGVTKLAQTAMPHFPTIFISHQ